MTRLMYDSTNIQDEPANAALVGYYVDGIYAVSAGTVRARFPKARLVGISAIGSNAGIVGDQEPGCMSIEQAVAWVKMRRAMGFDPSIYVNEMYGWAGARHAFDAYGVPEPHWWVADYDGIPRVPAGAVAKQYANPTLTHGHFDLSVVADFWPGVDGQSPSGIGHGGGPGTGVQDMDADEHKVLYMTLELVRNLYFSLGLPVANPADPQTAKSPVLDGILAAVNKPEPTEVESSPGATIPSQVAADLATVAGFLRKLGQ